MRLEEKNETSDIDSNSVNFENETTQNEPQFQSGQANDEWRLFQDQQEIMSYFNFSNDNIDRPRIKKYLTTYSLKKTDDFDGFGLIFLTEKITPSQPEHKLVFAHLNVDPSSPAELAGIKLGQRLVAVNSLFLNKDLKTLEEAVAAIETSYLTKETTKITVIEPEFWIECLNNPNLAAAIAEITTRF